MGSLRSHTYSRWSIDALVAAHRFCYMPSKKGPGSLPRTRRKRDRWEQGISFPCSMHWQLADCPRALLNDESIIILPLSGCHLRRDSLGSLSGSARRSSPTKYELNKQRGRAWPAS
jgi:hypothetical protein